MCRCARCWGGRAQSALGQLGGGGGLVCPTVLGQPDGQSLTLPVKGPGSGLPGGVDTRRLVCPRVGVGGGGVGSSSPRSRPPTRPPLVLCPRPPVPPVPPCPRLPSVLLDPPLPLPALDLLTPADGDGDTETEPRPPLLPGQLVMVLLAALLLAPLLPLPVPDAPRLPLAMATRRQPLLLLLPGLLVLVLHVTALLAPLLPLSELDALTPYHCCCPTTLAFTWCSQLMGHWQRAADVQRVEGRVGDSGLVANSPPPLPSLTVGRREGGAWEGVFWEGRGGGKLASWDPRSRPPPPEGPHIVTGPSCGRRTRA